MKTRWRYGIGLLLTTTVGVAAGSWYERRSQTDVLAKIDRVARTLDSLAVTSEAAARLQRGSASAQLDDGASLSAVVRLVVREELAAARSVAGDPDPAAARPGAPLPRTGESAAALAEGRTVVETARARGQWRQDDAEALRSAITRMDDRGRDEVLVDLTKAVNLGQLTVEIAGPLL